MRSTSHDSLAEQTGCDGPTVTYPVTTPSITGVVLSELARVVMDVVELLPSASLKYTPATITITIARIIEYFVALLPSWLPKTILR